mmetsp:Transcript_71950/g.158881  ORF Transcript_71950/g.158881 Transcript_71950/m.158881 type:complete len:392 (-) Transcript_71950:50-1225(-)
MVQFVLKTSYQGDIRRLTFDSVEQVSFEFIRTFVAKSYDVQDFLAKYQDEEGDWCTLTAATLSDAMDLVKDKQLLRLEIQSAGSRSPSALPPVEKAAETSPRSPSVCSWEMLDFDAEDEDMEIEEESVVATEVTQNTGEVSRVTPLDELPPPFPKGLESLESSESGADSEDSFLVAEAPASVDETSAGDDECFVLEPIDQANAQEDPAEPVEPAEPIDVDQEMPDVQPSAPPLAAAAPEPGPATEDAEELSSEEKINLILAAFDKNGDGRLNFEETIDLLMWAYAELIPFEVFKMTCDELRVDPQQGFGAGELTRLYDCFGTLERDFQAALHKLSHEPPPAAAAAAAAPPPTSEGVSSRISPWVALPLLPICPVAAGAVALAATLRNRACQ